MSMTKEQIQAVAHDLGVIRDKADGLVKVLRAGGFFGHADDVQAIAWLIVDVVEKMTGQENER